ncbi:MAG: hypothetical protein V9E94_12890 [Microthrixaceae bacterium]
MVALVADASVDPEDDVRLGATSTQERSGQHRARVARGDHLELGARSLSELLGYAVGQHERVVGQQSDDRCSVAGGRRAVVVATRCHQHSAARDDSDQEAGRRDA